MMNIEQNKQPSVHDMYKELIMYISQIGNRHIVTMNTMTDFTIELQSPPDIASLVVHLFQPLEHPSGWYHRDYVKISWRIPPCMHYGRVYEFHQDTDQKVIFNTLLYLITDSKLKDFEERMFNRLDSLLSSDSLIEWFKSKEEQIRAEEKEKVEKHLSVEEFKKVMKEELNSAVITLKINSD